MKSTQSLEQLTVRRAHATALLVLGMHRSGTSALTRVCNLLGARLGSDLLPPAADNVAGFWEQREIQNIHEELLREFGSSWFDHRPMPADWFLTERAAHYRQRIVEVLRRSFADAPVWAVKDPRICRLVPFWVPIIGTMKATPFFLLVARNPLEVALSLEKRDRFAAVQGLLIWLRHVLDAERDSRGFARAFITYDSLLADWRQVVMRAAKQLGIDAGAEMTRRATEIDRFLSRDHRHQQVDDKELAAHPLVTGWARETYEAFQHMCAAPSEKGCREFDRIAREVARAEQLYGNWLTHERSEVAARGARIDGLATELASAHKDLAERQSQLELLGRELDEVRVTMSQREARLEELTADLQAARVQIGERDARLETAAGEVARLRRELEVREKRIGELSGEVRSVRAELATVRDELARELDVLRAESAARIAELAQALASMQHSWSWRLTQPGRGLVRWLNRKLAPDRNRIGVEMLSNEFHGCVDEPSEWEVPERMMVIRGWCFHNQDRLIRGIRARVGHKIFKGQLGAARPDVAKEHSDYARADHSGFEVAVNVPRGRFRIVVEVRPDGLGWVKLWLIRGQRPMFSWEIIHAQVGRQRKKLGRQLAVKTLSSHYAFHVDDPPSWALPSRQLLIRGWCFHKGGEGIKNVRAMISGREWKGRYGMVRRDVAESFPHKTSAPCSGFVITAQAPRGRFAVVIEVQNNRDEWVAFCEANGRVPIVFSRQRPEPAGYATWLKKYDCLTWTDKMRIRKLARQLKYQPTFSVIIPTYNTPELWLRRAIESVRMQLYPHWELCIANDASTQPHVKRVLDEYARKDKRIKVVHREKNGHIAVASNSALELATGEFVALLDSDDELRPHSLFMVAEELNRHPETDLIYTDEDKIDGDGNRFEPYFKTDWNPDLVRSANYVNHLGVYRTKIVKGLRGFRHEFVGSQDYDLLLRFTDEISADRIRHVPHILYHWRAIAGSGALTTDDKPYAHISARKALEEHLRRRRVPGTVQEAGIGRFHRIAYTLPKKLPLLALIMPTGGKLQFLAMGLKSVLKQTDYDNLRLILLPNNVKNPESLKLLEEARKDRRVQLIPYDEPYNFSRMNNVGVAVAGTELIGFFNDDLEVINPDWLKELVSHALRPEVGGVGPLLFFPDNTVQHAGVILGIGGVAGHGQKWLPRGKEGYFGRAGLIQSFSAITAGCMVMRQSVFQEVGGFDEKLAVAFNDVDLCLKIRDKGYLLTWTPYAKLYHHESVTLGVHSSPVRKAQFDFEVNYLKERWGDALLNDPFYNPNLSLRDENFALAFPPRVAKSWRPVRLGRKR